MPEEKKCANSMVLDNNELHKNRGVGERIPECKTGLQMGVKKGRPVLMQKKRYRSKRETENFLAMILSEL